MSAQPSNSNQKLLGLLAYLLTPIVGIIILVSENMKSDPVLRKHAVQSIAYGIVAFVISTILTFTVVLSCLFWVPYVPLIIWGIQAYQGKDVNIPVITDFCKNQNWI
ncbi:MAG: hypothetical protein ACUVR3_13835 [Candidatus Roseilinea sp.]|uniref:hypothetical protein n=1 Tax=Candidatus Roseilinea sp. TaxID=2838777 RepID=UPI00404910BF